MDIKSLLWEYRFIIAIVVSVILFAAFEWEKFKGTAYALMLRAKSMAKDAVLKSGAQQEEWVVKKAYQFLPRSITIFISEEVMRKIVHYLYVKAKDKLDDGQLNGSVK